MPSPKSSPRASARPATPRTRFQPPPQPNTPPEVVDPIWLAKALAISFSAALFCAWLTACLLFYQGEWQLILHPVKTIDRTPANAGLAYEPVRFDTAETGQPQLTAWWIPAAPGDRYSALTILYLHDGSTSLSGTVDALARLHRAGLNIFAIDYRSFGQSDASAHPTEARMTQDTAAALDYLVSIRHIAGRTIIPDGIGLGASLAAGLAHDHPELPAVILENPDPDPTATAVASHPSHFVPVRLLFREHFEIAATLARLPTPKLLIAGDRIATNTPANIAAMQVLFEHAASPSLKVTLLPAHYDADYQTTLDRFLGQNFASPPPSLTP